MKKFFWYSIITILLAFVISYITKWAFWKIIFVMGAGYGIYAIHSSYPSIAKWLTISVIVVLISSWFWTYFMGNLPLSYATLPYAKNWRDAQLVGVMDPGLSKARTVLLLELRKKEDKLAADIPALMQAGKHELVITQTQELIDLRKKIEKLIMQAAPTPKSTSIANVPATASTFTVNKGERKATISHPDKTIVHFEANKAFAILERNGTNPDGSFILSPINIPVGKSQRYFAWGGSPYIEGLYDDTQVTVSY